MRVVAAQRDLTENSVHHDGKVCSVFHFVAV